MSKRFFSVQLLSKIVPRPSRRSWYNVGGDFLWLIFYNRFLNKGRVVRISSSSYTACGLHPIETDWIRYVWKGDSHARRNELYTLFQQSLQSLSTCLVAFLITLRTKSSILLLYGATSLSLTQIQNSLGSPLRLLPFSKSACLYHLRRTICQIWFSYFGLRNIYQIIIIIK